MNLYAHTPFCLSKCGYCALASVAVSRGEVPQDFPDLLAREFGLRCGAAREAATIYLGGGTPTMLGAGGLERLARALEDAGLSRAPDCEWSMECNPAPELARADVFEKARALGVNRLSFGVQSFDDGVLARAGRRHSAADAARAVALARAAGFANVGIDLIAGLPGDDGAKWRATLDRALELGVEHVSVYSLILEPGTRLAREAGQGRWRPCPDEALLERLALAEEALEGAGFRRYEISNYAKPGFECRHNLACWRGEDYLGIGPGAASRLGLARRTNAPDWRAWREALAQGRLPPAESEEKLTPEDDAEERFVFGLRMAEGVAPGLGPPQAPSGRAQPGHHDQGCCGALGDRPLPWAQPGHHDQGCCGALGDRPLPWARWEKELREMGKIGITREIAPGRWALTARGREVADAAIERLMA